MNASTEMPRYQCHKKVWALKIAAVEFINTSDRGIIARITPHDAGYAPLEAGNDWQDRYQGSDLDLGYYVVYDDGYASWSPTKAFEDGYSRIGR